ncbi:MAG: AAA family ATPase [Acidimicrobiia bacterium]|nr:AAA family ATPase [Acidimicrobiia bacterium]
MIDAVDALLAERSVVAVVGRGGVGKTTVAAALGVRAAQHHDRRVLVVTVDPARRLADALGVNGLEGEAVIVPVGGADGRLWVLMVEMSSAWDQLVRNCAPDMTTAEDLLANGLYRSLTTRFVASHDYVALDHLLLLDDGRFDLIIVDTPPGNHADDLFAAPGRLSQFFDSRLLRWLTAGVGGGVTRFASRPFQLVARRLLGTDFLDRIGEFFMLFARLRPRLVERIDAVERLLASPTSAMVEVRAADSGHVPEPVEAGNDVVVVNRLLPLTEVGIEPAGGGIDRVTLDLRIDAGDVEALDDASLRAAVLGLMAATPAVEMRLPKGTGLCLLPRLSGGVNRLEDLVALTDEAAAEPWRSKADSSDPVL